MSDAVDLANDEAQIFLEKALGNIPKYTGGVSAITCEECGYTIPEARRLAVPGTLNCADCQSLFEERSKHIWGGY